MVTPVVVVLLLSAAPPAASDPLPAIEAREADARTACGQGRVEDAIAILGLLFDRTGDSGYLFNQGRCYQQNGRRDEALIRFRAFLQRPDITPDARTRAEQYVDELARGPAPQARPLVAGRAVALPLREPPSVTDAPPPAEATDQAGPRPLRVAAVVAAGVAVASVGTATYFALRVRNTMKTRDRELERPEPPPPDRVFELDRRGRTAESWQWVFLGTGAVALATGAACYLVDRRLAQGSEQASVSLLFAPGGGGALVKGTF
jgi:hypothetical protein